MLYTFLSVFILIVCALLILVVLVQNSKGGGLASNFTGNQVMGVRRTADFLEKATWTLAGALLILSIFTSWAIPKQSDVVKTRLEDQTTAPANFDPNAIPAIPSGEPDNQPAE